MIRAVHHLGIPLSKYYLDYRVLCEVNMAALRDFELDVVQAISDPYREACDIGLEVEFPYDQMPMHRSLVIREPEDLAKVKFPVQNLQATKRLRSFWKRLPALVQICSKSGRAGQEKNSTAHIKAYNAPRNTVLHFG